MKNLVLDHDLPHLLHPEESQLITRSHLDHSIVTIIIHLHELDHDALHTRHPEREREQPMDRLEVVDGCTSDAFALRRTADQIVELHSLTFSRHGISKIPLSIILQAQKSVF
jgi:hypothetical protein